MRARGPRLPRRVRLHPGVASGRVRAPPSKSYTHRALLVAHLAQREFRVLHPLESDDTRATLRGLHALGSAVEEDASGWTLSPGRLARSPRIGCGESGTTLRFLAPVAARSGRTVHFHGADGLARRPMSDLLRALQGLGAQVRGPPPGRSLPFSVRGPLRSGRVHLPTETSSQFTSALLFALPLQAGDSDLVLEGRPVSIPYVLATVQVLHRAGIRLRRTPWGWHVPGDQRVRGRSFEVPGDASSAAYPLALAALTGGRVRVEGLTTEWPQADTALLGVLRACGARVREASSHVEVTAGPGPLSAFEASLDDAPDLAPLLTVLACRARGRSRLLGGAHLVHKESDRRAGCVAMARALGAGVRARRDGLTITGPGTRRSLRLSGWTDHRMVMSAAVAGASLPEGATLSEADCVAKSYPRFWQDLRALGPRVEALP